MKVRTNINSYKHTEHTEHQYEVCYACEYIFCIKRKESQLIRQIYILF